MAFCRYDRRYEDISEMEQKFANFRKTLKQVDDLNHLEKLTHTEFGINDMADMNDEEFKQV